MQASINQSRDKRGPRTTAKSSFGKPCIICGKCFERSDTLRRHVEIHDQNRKQPKLKRKACSHCNKSKVKCSAERPSCTRCAKRGLECVYEYNVDVSKPLSSTDSSVSGPQTSYALGINGAGSTDSFGQISGSIFDNHLVDTDMSAMVRIDHGPSPLDWLFPVTVEDTVFMDSMQIMQTLNDSDNFGTLNMTAHSQRDNLVHGAHQNFSVSRLSGHLTPRQEDPDVPEDRWPMNWCAAPVQLSSLPELDNDNGNIAYSNRYSIPRLGEATVAGLRDYLQIPMDGAPWIPVFFELFPTKEQIDQCLDLYFTHFDKFFPMIHRPTFDPVKDPSLTLAMIAIGSRYSGAENSNAFSTALCELVRRLLLCMAERDPRHVRTESYLTAQLLQSIHGFSSGSKRLYELSDTMRCSIVINARCMNLFEQKRVRPRDSDTNIQRWETWICVERWRRLAWAVVLFDTAAATCRNSRPLLSSTELVGMELPCSADRWEAESHQAWAALHPWTDFGPPNLSFKAMMNGVLRGDGQALLNVTDDDHRTLIATMLARGIYDARESAFEACPSPQAAQSINRLLGILDQLDRPVKSNLHILAPRAFNVLVQQMQLKWGAHVLATDDVCDYLHFIWEGSYRATEAQDVLVRWAQRSPAKLRMTAFAAGQLFSLTRQYPCNHPWESYSTFHAAMFLWSVAGLLLNDSVASAGSSGNSLRRPICQLDWLGPSDSPEGRAIQEWLENGGNYVLRMHGIPDLASEDGMRQLLQETADELRRKSIWGIAHNFRNAVLRVLDVKE